MNCFEWISRSSDYLDGTLIGAKKQEADQHLDRCTDCNERYKHFRLIITAVASKPRSSVPISLQKAPFSSRLPRLDLGLKTTRWARIPWYIRTPLEAAGIVFLTLATVSIGPKLRILYEKRLEKSLSDFGQIFSESSPTQQMASNTRSSNEVGNEITKYDTSKTNDEFSSEGGEEEDAPSPTIENTNDDTNDPAHKGEDQSNENIKVGKADVWRFILRTDSPQDLRPKITTLLKTLSSEAGDSAPSSKAEGVNAPGGIQFDLVLQQSAIPKLKRQLFELAPPTPDGLADTPAGETFTWYKIKSKRALPKGKVRVVIWISQI